MNSCNPIVASDARSCSNGLESREDTVLVALLNVCGEVLRSIGRESRPSMRNCLTFRISGALFGIDAGQIKEIVRCGILAEPGDKPSFVRGLFRHQSVMVPVLDISARYGTHRTEPSGRTCIVILQASAGYWQQPVGLIVDEVCAMHNFADTALKPLPAEVSRMMNVEIVEGLVKLKKDLLIVIDPLRLMSPDEAADLADYLVE